MEQWKIDLCDSISNVKVTGRKQVMIRTASKEDGAVALKNLSEHINSLHSSFKSITGESNPKDFRVNSTTEWGNDDFLARLQALREQVANYNEGIDTETTENKGGDNDGGGGDDENDNTLVIFAALAFVGAIIFYVWKK